MSEVRKEKGQILVITSYWDACPSLCFPLCKSSSTMKKELALKMGA